MAKFRTIYSNLNPTVSVSRSGATTLQASPSEPKTIIEIQEKIVEVPVEKIVIKEVIKEIQVPVPYYETKEVEVIREVPVYVDRIVEKEVIKEIDRPTIHVRTEYKDRVIEIPRIVVRENLPAWAIGVMVMEALIGSLFYLIK